MREERNREREGEREKRVMYIYPTESLYKHKEKIFKTNNKN